MSPVKQPAGKDTTMDITTDISKDAAIKDMANPGAIEQDTGSTTGAAVQVNSLTNHLKGLGITAMDDLSKDVFDHEDDADGGVRLEGTNDLVATDENGVKTQSSPTGRYQNRTGATDASKPYSPGAYGNTDFVRHGAGSRDDDPFSSPSNRTHQHGNGNQRSVNTTPTRRLDLSWRSGSSGSSVGEGSSPTQNTRASQPRVRPGRNDKEPITGQNAQAFYPPSACVFVANLLQTQDEVQLEYAVTKTFSQFGPVFVKIRRDDKNMPYAFCQYTVDEDATRAIQEGRGEMIHGRPCRTERAKANRVYWMSRKDGHEIPLESEALAIAKQFGLLDDHWTVNSRFQAMNGLQGLHPGFFIQYKFYENGRDAQTAMRGLSSEFELSTPHLPYDGSTPRHGNSRTSPRDSHCRNYLSEYAVDRNSIFVGNLPNDLTSAQIAEMFAACGEIINVKLHHMPSTRPGCDVNVFAFIHFGHPMAVRHAISSMNGLTVDREHTLRVKQKDSNHGNATRARRSFEHDRSQHTHQSPTPARHDASSAMAIATPMQGHQYSNGAYPPTPGSQGYGATYGHQGYAHQQWQQMSPMQLGGSPPPQAYWPGYYQYPAYPGYGYQYQYPADYSAQAQQQYMQMGYGNYGYPAPAAQYAMDTNSHEEAAMSPTPVVQEQDPIATEQDSNVEQ